MKNAYLIIIRLLQAFFREVWILRKFEKKFESQLFSSGMLISDICEILEGFLVSFRNELVDAGMIPQRREPELGHTIAGTGLAIDDRFRR
jgi:hypothetical protein